MTFPITKTADHTVAVGDLLSTTVASAYLFPTYLVTSDGTAIGSGNALYVQASSLPLPTGAATDTKQDTGNVSLASIDGKTPSLGQALAAASVPVVLTAAQLSTLTPLATVAATQSGTWNVGITGTFALPTGASTEAKQDAGNTSLSNINGKLPALGQALAAASVPVVLTAAQVSTLTPLSTVAATQSGTWTVGISGAVSLPTGAATEAKQDTGNASLSSMDGKTPALGQALAAASVPVVLTASQLSTLTPPAAISGFATSAKQDTGNASLSSIDGKITAVNTGAVVVSSSALPSGAATAAKQPALGTAGTPSADVVSIQGVASGTVVPISDGGGSITVDGAVAVTGTFWQATQPVSLASVPSHAVTNAGTFAVQVDGAALTSLQLLDDAVSGSGFNVSQINGVAPTMGNGASGTGVQRVTIANDSTGILAGVTTVTTCSTVSTLTGGGVAHDGADSGSPHKIGAKAVAGVSGQTKVAAGDRTDLLAGVDGLLVIQLNCSKEDIVSGVASITDGSNTSVIAQQGIGIKTYITDIIIANTSATAVTVDIRDGVGGSVKATFPAPANTGGVVHSFKTPIPFTAGTEVCADPSAAVSTVTVTLVGFKSKV